MASRVKAALQATEIEFPSVAFFKANRLNRASSARSSAFDLRWQAARHETRRRAVDATKRIEPFAFDQGGEVAT